MSDDVIIRQHLILNESAKQLFDPSHIDEIPPVDEYPIWEKTDPYGRTYYGVSNFWGVDSNIEKDCDLSWLEWDGNEVNVDSDSRDDLLMLFQKTVGIMKSWKAQLTADYPDERFVIFASFDDGSELIEGSDPYIGFTLRFWKIREGQGFHENTDSEQPLLKMIIG